MKWPWQSSARRSGRLCFSASPAGLAWVLADLSGPRPHITRAGLDTTPLPDVADLSAPALDLWARPLQALALAPQEAHAVLGLPDYQLLQIEAPAVPPEELRAAARWHIRDLVSGHVDDITLDVLRVGLPRPDGQPGQPLFVVAAPSTGVARAAALARHAGWPLRVVDVADLAQRNLHTAATRAMDLADRASACLVRHDTGCLLTLCVGDELYDSRRLDWDPQLPRQARHAVPADPGPMPDFGLDRPAEDSSRLVVELQRSFDVWERSWPDLPLSLLYLHLQGDTLPVAGWLQDQLGLRVLPLPVDSALDAEALDTLDDALLRHCLPLAGALLRQVVREA